MTNNNSDNTRKYLVTEAVDIKALSQEKVSSDLKILEKFETRSKIRTDLSRGMNNTKLSRVMKALQLTNPFKGY